MLNYKQAVYEPNRVLNCQPVDLSEILLVRQTRAAFPQLRYEHSRMLNNSTSIIYLNVLAMQQLFSNFGQRLWRQLRLNVILLRGRSIYSKTVSERLILEEIWFSVT